MMSGHRKCYCGCLIYRVKEKKCINTMISEFNSYIKILNFLTGVMVAKYKLNKNHYTGNRVTTLQAVICFNHIGAFNLLKDEKTIF